MKKRQIITGFWESIGQAEPKGRYRQNSLPCDVRCSFGDWIDALARAGEITERQAQNTTLDA